MHLERKKSPLHFLLGMKDMQGNMFEIEGAENLIFVYPGGYSNKSISFSMSFENFAKFVWTFKLQFVSEDGCNLVSAFTSIQELCNDLEKEHLSTDVFHFESQKIFHYIPSSRTFINDQGIYKQENMEDGNYMYCPFVYKDENSNTQAERMSYFRQEMLCYDDIDEFAHKIGVEPHLYQRYEEGIYLSPKVREAVLTTFPWLNPEWLAGNI